MVFITGTASSQRDILAAFPEMADMELILSGKYPAKAHVKKVVEWMRKTNPNVSGVLYLEGQKTRMIEDNDGEALFRSV